MSFIASICMKTKPNDRKEMISLNNWRVFANCVMGWGMAAMAERCADAVLTVGSSLFPLFHGQ